MCSSETNLLLSQSHHQISEDDSLCEDDSTVNTEEIATTDVTNTSTAVNNVNNGEAFTIDFKADAADPSMCCQSRKRTADAETPVPRRKVVRQRKGPEISDRELMEAFIKSGTNTVQQADDVEYFGQSVACTLRRLSPKQQALAKIRINQVLFDIEFADTSSAADTVPPNSMSNTWPASIPVDETSAVLDAASILSMAMQECGIPTSL